MAVAGLLELLLRVIDAILELLELLLVRKRAGTGVAGGLGRDGIARVSELRATERELSIRDVELAAGKLGRVMLVVRRALGCARTALRTRGTLLALLALLRTFAVAGHSSSRGLARLPMSGMRLAPAAVLAQLDPLRVVALALVRLIVAPLAVLACEGDGDSNVSAGHGCSRVGLGK